MTLWIILLQTFSESPLAQISVVRSTSSRPLLTLNHCDFSMQSVALLASPPPKKKRGAMLPSLKPLWSFRLPIPIWSLSPSVKTKKNMGNRMIIHRLHAFFLFFYPRQQRIIGLKLILHYSDNLCCMPNWGRKDKIWGAIAPPAPT